VQLAIKLVQPMNNHSVVMKFECAEFLQDFLNFCLDWNESEIVGNQDDPCIND